MTLPVKLLVALSLVLVNCDSQKVEVTRTALHVARSLDPEAMEEMKVKTRTGEVATLLVKKRDGRQTFPFIREEEQSIQNKTISSNSSEASKPPKSNEEAVPKPVVVSSEPIVTKKETEPVSFVTKDSARELKINIHPVPEPVYIRSSSVLIKGKSNEDWENRARSLMTIDKDGIPVIEGVRVPDDESDKVVWRNARVIDGKLTPYDKTQSKHNFDSKTSFDKKKITSAATPQWVRLDPAKPISDKHAYSTHTDHWNSAPVVPPPAQEKFKPSELIAVVTTPSAQEWVEFHHPQHNVQIVEEPVSYLPENDRYIRDRILEYIKRINKEEYAKTHDPNRDSRMIKESVGQPQIQARVLHNPGAPVYPTSLLYSPPSHQLSRVSFEEGVRTPVLQYAHPELGVQPAKVVTNPDPDVTDNSKLNDRREQALAYFAHDIHADRSPYALEPGLEDEARVDDFGNNGKRSHSGLPQRPKKTLPYFYGDQPVTSSYKDKYYGKYSYHPNGYPSYSAYTSAVDVRPFWQRMSDTIKEQFQSGMEKVSDLTRPVMDPLVEASHKISKNLGLESSGYREFNTLKEKLGVAGTPSVILPALGLVAGGAALGLGAVAVGRYLDVDMLKRSKDSDVALDDVLSAEHKRAMASIARSLVEDPNHPVPLVAAGAAETAEAMEVVKMVEAAESAEAQKKAQTEQRTRRRRRSLEPEEAMDSMLQSLDPQRFTEGTLPSQTVWSTTPCAKKVFCEVMISQSDDSVLLTEKKMATYLRMIHPSMAGTVGYHLDDVMRGVRSKDCSAFFCPSVRAADLADFPGPR